MARTRRATCAVILTLVALTALATGCGDEPGDAFDRLRAAVGTRDPQVLYHALDTDSRWAVDSIWSYHREIATAAEGLAEPARGRLLQRVAAAAQAPSPAAWFGARADELAPLALLGGGLDGLGTLASARKDGARATIITSTGLEVPMARGPDGKWGWSAFGEKLAREKDAAANDAARVAEDVRRLVPVK